MSFVAVARMRVNSSLTGIPGVEHLAATLTPLLSTALPAVAHVCAPLCEEHGQNQKQKPIRRLSSQRRSLNQAHSVKQVPGDPGIDPPRSLVPCDPALPTT